MRRATLAVVGLVLASCTTATSSAPVATTTTVEGASAGSSGVGDPYFVDLGNGGYDVGHYRLELDYEPSTNRLKGRTTISATATEDVTSFNLDLTGMEVGSVTIDGRPVPFDRRRRELVVEAPLTAGDDIEVVVDYGGEPQPIEASDSAPFSLGWIATGDGSYVASEPDGASTFFPVNDHPSDKATYSFVVRVPDGLTVATNGLLVATVDAAGPTTTWTWEASDPLASYLVQVAIGELTLLESSGPGGLPIRHAVPPDLAAEARRDLAVTDEMITVLSEAFGPFPLEAYGALIVDDDIGFALETSTLALFDRGVIDGDGANEALLVHELAHQWFGDALTPATWREIWLNEGFATYAEWLWEAHRAGDPGVVDEIARQVAELEPELLSPPGDPGVVELFGPGVYQRGALTLHALRLEVGDEAFFATLAIYVERFAGANVATDDFVAVAEEVSGRQLHPLFDAWLYDESLPDLPPLRR